MPKQKICFMVWGAISWKSVFTQISTRSNKNGFYVVQDNAPCHRSKKTLDHLKQENISFLQHPPNSPDLNAIELVWLILKRKIQKLRPQNQQQLESLMNIECLQQCADKEFIRSDTKSCVKQCADKEFISSDTKTCIKICDDKEFISSDTKSCVKQCTDKQFISSDTKSCVKTCADKEFISFDSKSCVKTCTDKQFISSDTKSCVKQCADNEFIGSNSKSCVRQCSDNEYISSDIKYCVKQLKYTCKAVQNLANDLTNFKSSIQNVVNQGINTDQALKQAQSQINLYASSSYDKVLQSVSDKQEITVEDKTQVKSALSDLFQICKQLVSNTNPQASQQSIVISTPQMKINGQSSKFGYKFSSSLNFSSQQNGDSSSLLEQDTNQNQSQSSQVQKAAFLKTSIFCQQEQYNQKLSLVLLNIQTLKLRNLQQSQNFSIKYSLNEAQDYNKYTCFSYDSDGKLTTIQAEFQMMRQNGSDNIYQILYQTYSSIEQKFKIKRDTISKIWRKYQKQGNVNNNYQNNSKNAQKSNEQIEGLVQETIKQLDKVYFSLNNLQLSLYDKYELKISKTSLQRMMDRLEYKYGTYRTILFTFYKKISQIYKLYGWGHLPGSVWILSGSVFILI
ncbi:hypothetical protein ABPG72_022847 [Tetrahymena utriculariae]